MKFWLVVIFKRIDGIQNRGQEQSCDDSRTENLFEENNVEYFTSAYAKVFMLFINLKR